MVEKIRTRLMASAVAIALSVGLLAWAPQLGAQIPEECGGNDGPLCSENEACAGFLWFKQCTTTYTYWPGPN